MRAEVVFTEPRTGGNLDRIPYHMATLHPASSLLPQDHMGQWNDSKSNRGIGDLLLSRYIAHVGVRQQ